MSILIKGMEMPKSCYDCPAECEDYICGITKGGCTWAERPPHCPLVPISPHGRLIDADALYGTFEASKDETIGHTTFKETVLLNIRGMPTIIEAEEGE